MTDHNTHSAHHPDDRFREKQPGRQRDIAMLSRLSPFIRPQLPVLFGAVFIVVLVTLLDLSIPYITKVAIDNYIVPRTLEAQPPDRSGDSPGKARKTRYLIVDATPSDNSRIIQVHPELFTATDEQSMRIAMGDLRQLPVTDIATLRKDDMIKTGLAAALIFGVAFTMFVLNFAQVMLMEYAGQHIMHGLRMSVFSHIQRQSVDFFSKNPVGRLVTRTTNDIQNMHEMFTSVITFFFKDVFLIIGISIVLVALSPGLALACFFVLPFVIIGSMVFAGAARGPFRMMRIKLAEINAGISETIEGMTILRLFAREARNFQKFRKINDEYYAAGIQQIHIFAIFMPAIEVLSSVALAVVIYFGGRGVISDTMTIGVLAAFIAYIKMFFRPIRDIAEKYNITQNAISSVERIFLVLDTHEEIPRPDKPASLPRDFQINRVDLHNVSFAYNPDEPVLQDVSFSAQNNETVAIVGPTGAGKTSIANLIMRFYDVSAGSVTINNLDIRTIPSSVFRPGIGLVMQDPFLFTGTIRDNILFTRKQVTDAELENILENARCREMIERLENGVDTMLTHRATAFSSGQRQLISIARAFANDPDLIIFDEATSYIDLETEMKVKQALTNLTRNRTAIIIAHRLSTVRDADRIIVLSRGRIVETGSHDQLMAVKGYYYKLNEIQKPENRIPS
ncbi:MAG: ABC transporter ATP-binding protein [Thermodesulfobacteriota bacterium]|nr:ABC transporter ATP-binding protein [Thermodesulfobacteriota bacterium]